MNQIEEFIIVSHQVATKVIPAHVSKYSNKIYRQSQLLTLIILKISQGWDYRKTELMIRFNPHLKALLELKQTPHYTTLQKFFARLDNTVIRKVFQEVLNRLKTFLKGKRNVLLDSTGYRITKASFGYLLSRWFKETQGIMRKKQRYIKHTILIDEKSLLILGQKVGLGPSGDCGDFRETLQSKPKWLHIGALAADQGFDSRKNHRYVRQSLKAKDAIKTSHNPCDLLRQRVKRYFPKSFYRYRAKVEGCISVIKRKFKNHILSRKESLRFLEASLTGVLYNIYRGIQLGILFLLMLIERVSTEPDNIDLIRFWEMVILGELVSHPLITPYFMSHGPASFVVVPEIVLKGATLPLTVLE